MVLSNFRKFKFSAPIFVRGAWVSGTLKTPKKVDPPGQVVLTTQLLIRNQNFLNISADTPPPPPPPLTRIKGKIGEKKSDIFKFNTYVLRFF